MNHQTRPPHIVVLDGFTLNPGDNPWEPLKSLGLLTVYPRTTSAQMLERAQNADILLTNKTFLTADILRQLPALRFISVMATGYNIVDVEAARDLHIVVSNAPNYAAEATAQHTMALLLEWCHRVHHHHQAVMHGVWAARGDFTFWDQPPFELTDKTIGIVGYGHIGQRVARLAQAFGMKVCAATSQASNKETVLNDIPRLPMEELFSQADVISLHAALTSHNLGFVNLPLLRKMKPTALLINTARGALINENDLAQALHQNMIAGAALDVLAVEPPPPDHPLLHAPRCIITPHMAWTSLATRQKLMRMTVENVRSFLAGTPIHVVT